MMEDSFVYMTAAAVIYTSIYTSSTMNFVMICWDSTVFYAWNLLNSSRFLTKCKQHSSLSPMLHRDSSSDWPVGSTSRV